MKVRTKVKAGAVFTQPSTKIEVDEDGFIVDPNSWKEDVAKAK